MSNSMPSDLTYLRSPHTIRKHANILFDRAKRGDSPYFQINLDKMEDCREYLLNMIKAYPNVSDIPFHSRWRHFECSNIDRVAVLKKRADFPQDKREEGRVLYELAIISVLLDAGAGANWQYKELETDMTYARSEGLAVAAFHMYQDAFFNVDKTLSASANGLRALTEEKMKAGFQISETNPMLGLQGRVALLTSLADVIDSRADVFSDNGRLGYFYDYVTKQADLNKKIKANDVFQSVLAVFSPIWPGRLKIDGTNLGDVWQISAKDSENIPAYIPFHKLSLWLTYSLLEPLIWHGFEIVDLDELTGLAEYRNGGFFIDSGVLTLKDDALLDNKHEPDSALIIEWRALTLSLLDKLWKDVLDHLSLSASAFPLVKLLEAGTWKAGRELAYKRASDGAPPINILSNGTVF